MKNKKGGGGGWKRGGGVVGGGGQTQRKRERGGGGGRGKKKGGGGGGGRGRESDAWFSGGERLTQPTWSNAQVYGQSSAGVNFAMYASSAVTSAADANTVQVGPGHSVNQS